MPGFIQALGGDDYTTRRLKQVEKSMSDVLGIIDLFAKVSAADS